MQLVTGADPENFGGGGIKFGIRLNAITYKDVRRKKGVNKPFEKCFHVWGVFRIFFREGAPKFVIFSSAVFRQN